MKFAVIALVLLVLLGVVAIARRRAAVREAASEQARSRSARNKARVATVSSNVRGVTAPQTLEPPGVRSREDGYVDDR